MGRGQWVPCGAAGDSDREISNVVITITDNAAVAEGQAITAVCNGKTFSSTIKNGIAKMYTSEVGTYTITVGEYSTMLICLYFGQFSTDIYSGTLKVMCTEAGGNGKTCHVQSCDNNYNFTDNYNLTQTFDTVLELTFLGIPAGKYLVTIDDRYRFFKEIVSIQTVNQIEVELKQWLYRNGDECVHNTGGWMKCLISGGHTPILSAAGSGLATGVSNSQALEFLSNNITINMRCVSNVVQYFNDVGSHANQYARSPVWANAFCGTIKTLPIEVSKYNKIVCDSSQTITLTLRSGEPNTTSTSSSTGTVLMTGKGNSIEFNVTNSTASLIIGTAYAAGGYGKDNNSGGKWYSNGSVVSGATFYNPGNIDYQLNSETSQIYLVQEGVKG